VSAPGPFRPSARRAAVPWHRRGAVGRVRAYLEERRAVRWVLLVAATAFVVGYLVTWLLFFPGMGGSAIVTVPDVIGMSRAAAERTLGREGLEVERGEAISNPRMPEGRILLQVPLPGEEVPRGTPIRIVASAGPELRTVPSVRGLDRAGAEGMLQRYGFRVAVSAVRDRREEGTLLGLRPAAGEPAAVGSTVELFVSAGPPFVHVPSITGLAGGDARARLEAVGLSVGATSYAPGSPEPTGTVVAQTPAPGDSRRMGSAVRITVAGADPTPPPPPPPVAPEPDWLDPLPADGEPVQETPGGTREGGAGIR
jgi:eukaryotic-like serine/threonine-protein kinase